MVLGGKNICGQSSNEKRLFHGSDPHNHAMFSNYSIDIGGTTLRGYDKIGDGYMEYIDIYKQEEIVTFNFACVLLITESGKSQQLTI